MHAMHNFKCKNEDKPVLEPSYCSLHKVEIWEKKHSVTQQTYRVLDFPISAGPIEEMVAGLTFHLSLEAKTVKIKSFVRKATLDQTNSVSHVGQYVTISMQCKCKSELSCEQIDHPERLTNLMVALLLIT